MLTQSNTHTKDYAPIGVRAQSQQIHNNSMLPRTRKQHYKNEAKQRLISIEAEKLWPDEYVTHGLAIAEGIETALSLAHGFEPVWAAIDANHLAKFPVIRSVEALLIARDNDPAGIKAAKQCAVRWVAAGREVRITNQDKNDINDMVTNG